MAPDLDPAALQAAAEVVESYSGTGEPERLAREVIAAYQAAMPGPPQELVDRCARAAYIALNSQTKWEDETGGRRFAYKIKARAVLAEAGVAAVPAEPVKKESRFSPRCLQVPQEYPDGPRSYRWQLRVMWPGGSDVHEPVDTEGVTASQVQAALDALMPAGSAAPAEEEAKPVSAAPVDRPDEEETAQCEAVLVSERGKYLFECTRRDGHEGPHADMNTRWRTSPPKYPAVKPDPYGLPDPENPNRFIAPDDPVPPAAPVERVDLDDDGVLPSPMLEPISFYDGPECQHNDGTCQPADPPATLGPVHAERDRLTDQLRPVVWRAVHENAATWESDFGGVTGTAVGAPDAVLVAVHAVIDAGWRPAAPRVEPPDVRAEAARRLRAAADAIEVFTEFSSGHLLLLAERMDDTHTYATERIARALLGVPSRTEETNDVQG